MSLSKNELIEGYVGDRLKKVKNFELKVQTSVLLLKFFEEKGYEFYFCPKIKQKDNLENFKTPDFHAKKENQEDLIGEIKQSLPNPSYEHYTQKQGKDISQLESYQKELVSISTPHGVFFSVPGWCNEAITEYIREISNNNELKNKVIVLRYDTISGGNFSKIGVDKLYGDFKDSDLNTEFEFHKRYESGEGDLEKTQGGYKIYYTEEELNETPIEYIMLILWHNVIPELINSSSKDRVLERIQKGENTIEFEVDQLVSILNKIYVLNGNEQTSNPQFKKEMIIKSMACFEKIGKAEKISDQNNHNPKYRVRHQKITTQKQGLIDYLIRELNKDEFEKRAEIDYKRTVNKQLNQNDTTNTY